MPGADSKLKFKAVLFDLDGTLIEFKFDVKGSREAMIKWLGSHRFDVSSLSEDMKTQAIFQWVRKQCEETGKEDFPSIRAELSLLLESFEYHGFTQAKPHPGSLHLLKQLKSEQVLCALVTNSGGKPVRLLLNEFGFVPYLSPVITRDEVENLKPDPEGILKAINDLTLERQDAVYVGDSVIDIQAARSAGVACIALAQGMYSREHLAEKNPDYLIEKIEQVEQILYS